MEPRKICQLACKGQARGQIPCRDLSLPGDPHPCGGGPVGGSWLTNFLPLSCWPRSWEMALGNHQSRKIATPQDLDSGGRERAWS